MIDLDFRYDSDIEERQHTDGHIMDIVDLYITKIQEILKINNDSINIYIFE